MSRRLGTAATSLPFGKGSMTWRVNMEPVVALGGGRALLLQVLHPLVAAGVERHSSFAADPFRRGFRTLDVMLKLAFGDPSVSSRQADLLRRIHERVQGTTPHGAPYRAMDPALLLWVWATLVDVSVLMYERAVRPLSLEERERYYREQKLVAYACGVPDGACPATYDDLLRYMDGVIERELLVTPTARLVAWAGRHPPLPRPFGLLAGAPATLVTAGLLPERFRDGLGYRWSVNKERLLRAVFFVSRVAAKVVPRPLRHLPNRYLIRRSTPLGLWRNRPLRLPDDLRPAS
ncbi:MAG: oxygenase MpaB family protein [Candidatus Binatia bacterium]